MSKHCGGYTACRVTSNVVVTGTSLEMKRIVSFTLTIIKTMLTYCRRKRLKARLFTVVNTADTTVIVPGGNVKLTQN
jgi:hypothetical protein